ncbi:phage tail protein [Rhodococcus qingshengii]|uniref:phage tail protein n=1 Tax=Rhodococcus qingshengii TaxID=334542 RepID=UPI0010A65AF3|nr:phage tail protein [Rhodococcus qingshengii]THJ70739.1 phage tail protein [Rhodococcus qingshengii]
MASILESEATKLVYIGPPKADGSPGKCWHLAGVNAGDEGVSLESGMKGHVFASLDLLTSEGAKQDGATFLRSVRGKREFDMPILIEGRTSREFFARHDEWWRSVEADRPGHLGFFTRYNGWSFSPVQLDSAPEPLGDVDPAGDYCESYLMGVTAMDPAYRSFDEQVTWTNELGSNEGKVNVRNAAGMVQWPTYTMNGPGRWWIQDPIDDPDALRLVATPMLEAGETLRIDTGKRRPTARVYSAAGGFNGRNVWGQLKGRRWLYSIPPWTSKEIIVRVEGGTTASSFIATGTPRGARPY